MKFLSVKDLRAKSAEIWKQLPVEKEMVITNNGRPVAILSSINDSNFEESVSAIRRARSSDALNAIQKESVEKGLDKLSINEIDEEITVVRNKRSH
jgi:antitoxin (DNA-binding transcriptional repressor) of toxin-antitoxin stability system